MGQFVRRLNCPSRRSLTFRSAVEERRMSSNEIGRALTRLDQLADKFADGRGTAETGTELRALSVELRRLGRREDAARAAKHALVVLAEAGRRAEALTMSQEAVDLYRELAAGNREAYLPDLAAST